MKVVELYSGIGGIHFALRASSIGRSSEVVFAADINTVCNEVYKYNFPQTNLVNRNMKSLTAVEINNLAPDVILMSPPCQPFTRLGKQKDLDDARNTSFLHVMELIPNLSSVRYIVVENVQGFEVSETRERLLNILKKSHFKCEEYLLNSRQLGCCNSRLRYYLLAKKFPEFPDEEPRITYELPNNYKSIIKRMDPSCKMPETLFQALEYNPLSDGWNARLLPLEVLKKYFLVIDAVSCDSKNSCCFTRGYTRYFEGTGSLLSDLSESQVENITKQVRENNLNDDVRERLLKELKLRCFTPKEIARLMCFPEKFSFPDHVSLKQQYKLICNSINVFVVSLLISHLVDGNT